MEFFDMDSRSGRLFAWTILLLTVVYIGGHFVKAHAWDGFIELNSGYSNVFSPQEDIKVNAFNTNDTRKTVEDSGVLIPGGEIQVTDSEGNVHDMEVIVVQEIEGGPVKIQGYLQETNEYYDLQMNLR